jgi:hypothetical protein
VESDESLSRVLYKVSSTSGWATANGTVVVAAADLDGPHTVQFKVIVLFPVASV